MPANVLDSTIETLNLADKHLRRHANSPTRAEPRAFAGLRGAVTPLQNAELIIEGIGPDALALTRARDTAATS
jgi:hypothetical protein